MDITEQTIFIPFAIRNTNMMDINKLVDGIKLSNIIEESIHRYTTNFVISNNIESSLFEAIYNDKLNYIISVLQDIRIINKIKKEEISAPSIAFLLPYQLNPYKWDKYIKKLKATDENNKVFVSNMFKCHKCKARKFHVTMAQTRSADEPMTIFAKCLECGNAFSINQ